MVNKLTAISISIALLCGGIYHEHHDSHGEDGYGMCDINCSEKNHKIDHHECVKCYNDNSRYIVLDLNNVKPRSKYTPLYPIEDYTKKTNSNFDLYCRPPPTLS